VWTLRDGVPVANAVVIGATDGRRTQILKGDVAADQPVIVDTITVRR
jgi:HlyD family secretion protein